jgi:hypothetical protein
MDAKHIFLTFVEEDLELVRLFRGQAKNKNNRLSFDDYSVQEAFDSANAEYIRSQIRPRIRAASVTICLIGYTTSSSRWVAWELNESYDQHNGVFGVRLHSNRARDIPPKPLTDRNSRMVDWDIDEIVRQIG